MGKRYSAATGIHGFRRRLVRRLINLWSTPAVLSERPLPSFGITRILVCRTSHSLGNSLLLTPLLAELERVYPGAEVDIVTQSPAGTDMYGSWPTVRNVMRLPSRFPPHLPWVLRILRDMRSTHYDLAIDPDPQSKTGRLLLRLAHARFKLGYVGSEKSGDVTHGVGTEGGVRHVAQVPVHLLRAAMHCTQPVPFPRPNIRLTDIELANGRNKVANVLRQRWGTTDVRHVIGIFANATGAKRLPRDWWFAMLDRLELLLPEHAFIEFTPAEGASMLDDRYPTMFCSNLRRMASCNATLDGFVSVDSGPMHLAWTSGTPTFGIFTGTDIQEWGPYGENGYVIDNSMHTPLSVAETIARHYAADRAAPTEQAINA
ncbi:MAG TPA: glycosyltransferase family 9 protein [Luteibacter sp.]|uniref:glycosyltransferase family 9 protein n=1 Tax=Luteibacter sp. TaxID=1886636 RepID=UPI002C681EA7|nr:glycosyltransferase family 9 protein [Luteibacter sp.]HVI53788.1 glycosyltransferase family 9 protein [Luteibacter sp.]